MDTRSNAPRFSMSELVEASGLSDRTIRYYIEEGLLQHAQGRGRSSYYTSEHLERLARIAGLRERGLSLAEIRESVRAPVANMEMVTESWDRFLLHPAIEIHVRSGAPDDVLMLVRRFQQLADQWFNALETEGDFGEH